jgi:hypothetical protein
MQVHLFHALLLLLFNLQLLLTWQVLTMSL